MNESLSALYMRDPETAAILRRQAMAQQLARAQNPEIMYRSAASPWVAGLQALAGNLGSMMAERDLGDLSQRRNAEANEFMANALAGVGPGMGQGASPQPQQSPQAAPARMGGAAIPAVSSQPLPPAQAPADLASIIQEASRETGIPAPILTAQIRQESNFDPNARGRSGEIGLMQIMPSTARRPGFGVQPVDPARLTDPRENILTGARYLAGRGRASGVTDWNDPAQQDRALAAYNGGGDPNYVQNVRRWLPQDGSAPAAIPASASAPQDAAPAGGQQAPAGGLSRERMVMAAMQGMNSNNPVIAERSRQLLQMAQALPQAPQRSFTTAAPGAALVDNQGNVVGQIPDRPSEDDRRLARWRELANLGENVTPQQSQERDILARRLGGASVTVNNNNQPEPVFNRELAQRGAARIDQMQPQASQAADAVRSAQRVQALLDQGVITGTGAASREAIERAFATAGLVDGRRVANTGQLMAELANATLAAAGGLSGPTSDRDIMFLREVAGGSIELTNETIRRIVAVAQEKAGRTLESYNRVVTEFSADQTLPAGIRSLYRPIELPRMDAQPSPQQQQGGIPRVSSREEMDRLPSGAVFYAPDGSLRRRP